MTFNLSSVKWHIGVDLLRAVSSVPLIHVSIFIPVQYYFDYYSLVNIFGNQDCDISALFLRLTWLNGVYCDSIYISELFSIKNATGMLIGIIMNLLFYLYIINIWILILPTSEHEISFHLLVTSSMYFYQCLLVFSVLGKICF